MIGDRLSVRGVLLLLALAAGTYVVGIAGLIALRIAPTAGTLSAHSEAVLREQARIHDRLNDLARTISSAERTLMSLSQGGTLDTADARRLAGPVRAQLDSVVGVDMSARFATIPPEMRLALASAATSEQNGAASVMEAIAALQVGRGDIAVERLTEADSLRRATERYLDQAQYLAIADVVDRERELLSAANGAMRIIGWWAVFGIALLGFGAMLVQRRLYRPLAELESSLSDVTTGNLSAEVTVRQADELGRLGAHFNRMTRVLRERADEERRRREDLTERFGQILEESTGEILLFEQSSLCLVRATHGARRALGYTADELRGRTPLEIWKRLNRSSLEALLNPLLSGEETGVRFSTVQTRKDGTTYPVEVTVHLSSVAQPPVFVAFIVDLSARERAHELSERLREFALEKGRVLGGGDLGRALAEVTRWAAETLGLERASVWRYEGHRIVAIDSYDSATGIHSDGAELLARDHSAYFAALGEGRAIAANDAREDARTCELAGKYLHSGRRNSLLAAPVRVGGQMVAVMCHERSGEPWRWTVEEQAFASWMSDLVAIAFEAHERSRTQEALLASEARYRAAFEQAGVGIAEADVDGRILRGNRAFSALLGIPQERLPGVYMADLTHPDEREVDADAMRRMLRGSIPVVRREKRWLRVDGSSLWTSVTAAPVHAQDGTIDHIITVIEDVTERRLLQSQLAHAQKMESIGRMAGGIAHDFNNLLTAILGYVELARQTVDERESLAADLREIDMASRRGAELTRQLLTFARRQVVEPRPLILNDLVRSISRLLRRLIGERIELVLDLDRDLSLVVADPGQLEQVIINMAVNARDAMPSGGRLTLRTRDVVLDEAWSEQHIALPPGTYVRLVVEDTGAGMDAETLSRIFEPFFTTKESGKGTGLGLATSYGIVRQAGGDIEAFSEPGRGTRLHVHLPIARGFESAQPMAQRPQAAVTDGNGRVVMVVDDEPQVRALMHRAFEKGGFRVISAASAEEALPASDRHQGTIDLLVTDIILPGMGGLELAEKLSARRPGLPVLYVSGYAESQIEHATLIAEGSAFLPKPFTATELASRAAELLAASA